MLLSSGSFLSPILLFRSIIEYEIDWFYIAQEPADRLRQFAGSGLIKHKKMINKAGNLGLMPENERSDALRELEAIDPNNVLRAASVEWEKVNLRRRAELLGERYLVAYDMGYAYFSGYTHPSAFNNQHFVSYGPNNSMRYHFFNKDHTHNILFNALDITNRMMRALDQEFSLGNQDWYIEINRLLDDPSKE